MSMTSESWQRAMLNAYNGNLNVPSATSNIINLPVQPHKLICDYCRGSLTGKEQSCPGCGARSSK